jgi:holo-[acyl-carrier-protein] synthase
VTHVPVGIGVDTISIERVRAARYLDRIAAFICTPHEFIEYSTAFDKVLFVAGRFALKEAVIKACPTPVAPTFFEIRKMSSGQPYVYWVHPHDESYTVLVSLTHDAGYATAVAYAMLPA